MKELSLVNVVTCTYKPLKLKGFYILIQIDFTGYLVVESQKVCAVN